jgi:hypothetical protein
MESVADPKNQKILSLFKKFQFYNYLRHTNTKDKRNKLHNKCLIKLSNQ